MSSAHLRDTILSIDAETNGLGGLAFAVGISVSDHTRELESAVFRCPIPGQVDPWVAENVLPALDSVEFTCDDYWQMLADIRARFFRPEQKPTRSVIAHVAWPVETTLLSHMLPGDLVWDGPYPLVDVASVLLAHGHDPLSVDDYLHAHGIDLPEGAPHHPLYDARAAALCLRHLTRATVHP